MGPESSHANHDDPLYDVDVCLPHALLEVEPYLPTRLADDPWVAELESEPLADHVGELRVGGTAKDLDGSKVTRGHRVWVQEV